MSDFDVLLKALEERAAPYTLVSGDGPALREAIRRHGADAIRAELPAIEGAINPVKVLCERLEGAHRRTHDLLKPVEPAAICLRGGGWTLTWVRRLRIACEAFEAGRRLSGGFLETIWVETLGQSWRGEYVLQNDLGGSIERFEVWGQDSAPEAFASLNRRRLALVGDLGAG